MFIISYLLILEIRKSLSLKTLEEPKSRTTLSQIKNSQKRMQTEH